jgi:hypothetical protein
MSDDTPFNGSPTIERRRRGEPEPRYESDFEFAMPLIPAPRQSLQHADRNMARKIATRLKAEEQRQRWEEQRLEELKKVSLKFIERPFETSPPV